MYIMAHNCSHISLSTTTAEHVSQVSLPYHFCLGDDKIISLLSLSIFRAGATHHEKLEVRN